MKRKWAIWLAAGMLVFGIGVLLYPTVSSAINRMNGSYAIGQLQQQLEGMDSGQMESALEEARAYNEKLKQAGAADEDRYDSILNFGNGIMGYVTVGKIDLMLPIYHGVSNDVLEKGVGHLPSSPFPIGGEGNHTVLTGHTGLPSARLFTDLAELTEGDRFEVTVGGCSTSYQIDQILVVLPQDTAELMPVAGEDYCTLVTCTPYGVNSHRLLVRGSRIEVPETVAAGLTTEEVLPEKRNGWLWLLLIPCLGAVMLLKRKKGKYE